MGKKEKLKKLQKRYDMVSDYLTTTLDSYRQQEVENRYLRDYIRYEGLEEEFKYFRENAHEEFEENLPFTYLTL